MANLHIIGLGVDWHRIGDKMQDWHWMERSVMDCQIGLGLLMDWHRIGDKMQDWHRMERFVMDCQIGAAHGLTLNWGIVNGLTDI